MKKHGPFRNLGISIHLSMAKFHQFHQFRSAGTLSLPWILWALLYSAWKVEGFLHPQWIPIVDAGCDAFGFQKRPWGDSPGKLQKFQVSPPQKWPKKGKKLVVQLFNWSKIWWLLPAPWLAEAIAPAAVVGAAQQPGNSWNPICLSDFGWMTIPFYGLFWVNHILVHHADVFHGFCCINIMLVSALWWYWCLTPLIISKAAGWLVGSIVNCVSVCVFPAFQWW